MHVRAGVGGALAALALAAPALAQAPAPAIGNFGGGFVLAPPKDPLGAGNAALGMRATAGGKLRIEATIPGRCGGGTFPAKAKVAGRRPFRRQGHEPPPARAGPARRDDVQGRRHAHGQRCRSGHRAGDD